jgi:hypothetical protein
LIIYIGTTACGTTANSADGEWTRYFCDPPVYANYVQINRGNYALL